jgi:hypothetical protein
MMVMMAADAPLVTAVRVILGFPPVRGHTGACLLSRLELFSPTGQSQQQDCRESQYQTLHRTIHVLLF